MYLCLQLNLELEHHEAARASFKPVVAHDQAVETVADFAASDGNIFSSGSSHRVCSRFPKPILGSSYTRLMC